MFDKVVCNPFVKRQTRESQFAHFEGTWEQLELITTSKLQDGIQGYKPGVMLVPVNPEGFFSSVTKLTPESWLIAAFKARRDGEEPFINVTAKGGKKAKAMMVHIVVYSHEVLEKDASSDAEFEIVSINASPSLDDIPMDPVTMMRNYFGKPGGTKGDFSAEQFAQSIYFWSQHALVEQ